MVKGDNIFKKFINSIYNLKEFPKYMKEGVGKAILYALILSIFIGGAKGIIKVLNFDSSSNQIIETIGEDGYKFSIVDGHLNLENSPLKIEKDNMLIYIDKDININEEGKLKSMTVNEDAYILMLNDGIILNSNINQDSGVDAVKATYEELNLANGMNNKALIEMVNNGRVPIMILLFIMYMVQEFIGYLFIALLIAALSLLPSKLFGLDIKLGELFSLVIYTATFPSLLVLVLTILMPNIPFDAARMVGIILFTYIILNDIRKEVS